MLVPNLVAHPALSELVILLWSETHAIVRLQPCAFSFVFRLRASLGLFSYNFTISHETVLQPLTLRLVRLAVASYNTLIIAVTPAFYCIS